MQFSDILIVPRGPCHWWCSSRDWSLVLVWVPIRRFPHRHNGGNSPYQPHRQRNFPTGTKKKVVSFQKRRANLNRLMLGIISQYGRGGGETMRDRGLVSYLVFWDQSQGDRQKQREGGEKQRERKCGQVDGWVGGGRLHYFTILLLFYWVS